MANCIWSLINIVKQRYYKKLFDFTKNVKKNIYFMIQTVTNDDLCDLFTNMS